MQEQAAIQTFKRAWGCFGAFSHDWGQNLIGRFALCIRAILLLLSFHP
jgi:hypothetical protein